MNKLIDFSFLPQEVKADRRGRRKMFAIVLGLTAVELGIALALASSF